jgi:hypothetical protein
MNLPFALPDWLPAWAFLLLAIPALLFLLAFLLMPFSVFGVKARLETIESQLDAVQEELRNLNLRARGVGGRPFADDGDAFDPLPNFGKLKSSQQAYTEARTTPPVPPPPLTPLVDRRDGPRLPQRFEGGRPPPRRNEPRLD